MIRFSDPLFAAHIIGFMSVRNLLYYKYPYGVRTHTHTCMHVRNVIRLGKSDAKSIEFAEHLKEKIK